MGCSTVMRSKPKSPLAKILTVPCLARLELLEARSITDRRVAEALGGLPERKQHCSVLAEEAIHAALENYESTRGDSRRVPAPEETSR